MKSKFECPKLEAVVRVKMEKKYCQLLGVHSAFFQIYVYLLSYVCLSVRIS